LCVGLSLTSSEKWEKSPKAFSLFRFPEEGIQPLAELKGYWEPHRAALAWLAESNEEFRKLVGEVAAKDPSIVDLTTDTAFQFAQKEKWLPDLKQPGSFCWSDYLVREGSYLTGSQPLLFKVPVTGFAENRYELRRSEVTGKPYKARTELVVPIRVEAGMCVVLAATHVSFLRGGKIVWRILTEPIISPVVEAATHHDRQPVLVRESDQLECLKAA